MVLGDPEKGSFDHKLKRVFLNDRLKKSACALTEFPPEVLSAAVWMLFLQTDLELADGEEWVLPGTFSHGCTILA